MANRKNHRLPRKELLRRLGERIRDQRHAKGLTQEALAGKLSLSIAYVSLIERGGRNPPYTTVVAVANALGTTASALVE